MLFFTKVKINRNQLRERIYTWRELQGTAQFFWKNPLLATHAGPLTQSLVLASHLASIAPVGLLPGVHVSGQKGTESGRRERCLAKLQSGRRSCLGGMDTLLGRQ